MKTTKKILSMLLAFAMICTLLAACSSNTPDGSTTGSNGGEGNNLDIAVDTPDTPDDPDAHIEQNPDTDPPVDSPDSSEDDTFDEVETAAIENAVVVRATKYEETDRIGFSCAAIIEVYGGEYTPFTFGVPISTIEGEYDPEKLEDLTGAIVNIDFDGVFMESYPLQIAGVTKVTVTGEKADDNIYKECEASFVIEEICEQDMYICEGWIVKAEPASDDSGNAVIYAMVQLGGCGVKDYVKLIYPKDRIRDALGEPVAPESIEAGTCFEFAYDGQTISASPDKAIFEIPRESIDYVKLGLESMDYTAEQYAEFEAYFETDK